MVTSETRLKKGIYWLNVSEKSRAQAGFSYGLIKELGKHILFSILLYVTVSFFHRLAFCICRIAVVSLVLTSLYFSSMGRIKVFVSALSENSYAVSFALIGSLPIFEPIIVIRANAVC